ncbi:hypothetical protein GJ744_007692 [Endocarpon pusillum]|uniref:Uncharacterized protein n=1 Tax=Endocarpon pusillum TaxID=364733 RepID=A0A8H7EBC5_9EURO|nr:hypothetical protein GJ744_007692 [Endocarpon pusillum]
MSVAAAVQESSNRVAEALAPEEEAPASLPQKGVSVKEAVLVSASKKAPKMSVAAAVQESSNRVAAALAHEEEEAPASLPQKGVPVEEAAPVSAQKKTPQKGPSGKWLQESLLHKRMGHLNREYVRMLPKSARSEFQVRFEKKQGACETCILAKQKRRPNCETCIQGQSRARGSAREDKEDREAARESRYRGG